MAEDFPDLALLHCFVTVAETGSFSTAAVALGLTQPAVTQRVQRLEKALGAALLDRAARPLRPTRAGELLLEEAPQLLARAFGLMDRLRRVEGAGRTVLRLGMPDSLSEIMGAEFLGAIQGLARQIELKSGISPWLETAFRARHFDLAVDTPPFAETADAGRIPLFHDPFVVVMPKRMAQLPLERVFARENHVGYGRTSKFGAACTAIIEGLGVTTPARFSFDSTQSLLRFVQAGYGWAITSAFCIYQSPNAARDLTLTPAPGADTRHFHLLYRTGEMEEVATAAATKFVDVFDKLVSGPWALTAPGAARLVRAVNGG